MLDKKVAAAVHVHEMHMLRWMCCVTKRTNFAMKTKEETYL